MICKHYRLLFGIFPIKWWQSFLVNRHFSQCPHCKETFVLENDEIAARLLVSPQRAGASASLWPGVRKGIREDRQLADRQAGRRVQLRWQWAAAVLIFAALVIPFMLKNGTVPVPGDQIEKPHRSILVRSVKLEGQPAYSYVFNSKDPEMTMFWVEKK